MYEENRENGTYRPEDSYSGGSGANHNEAGAQSYSSAQENAGSQNYSGSQENAGTQNYSSAQENAGAQNYSGSQENAGTQNYSGAQNYGGPQGYSQNQNTGTTGNGNYQYGGGYQYTYNSEYGSNQTAGGSQKKKNKKSGKGGAGKAVFAVVLAAVFGICVGGGVVGVSRFLNTGSAAQSDAAQSESSSAQATLQIAGQNESQAGTESSEADASDSISSTEVTQGNTQAGVADISTVAANVMPSIVSVYNSYTQNTAYFGQTYSREVTSTGSGIIVGQTDSELLIVTNNHVVDGEESLKVQFVDNTTAEAQLKGTDPGSDLAVIAVDLSSISSETSGQIKVATLGSSDDLLVGESVIAIGNALGYGQSVTVGVVSALDREITTSDGATGTFIQTDAAINPGNSGGALVNTRGEVIGINSNKIGGTSVEGMGYAIPISRAEPIIQNLMNQETRSRVDSSNQGYLGISGVSVTEQISSAYNMPTGVYVAQVMEDGAAANSDLQTGDIITAFNGSGITSMDDLKEQLAYYEAGTEVTLTVKRANSENGYDEIQVTVTLGTQPETQTQDQQQQQQSGQSGNGQGNLFGYFFGN